MLCSNVIASLWWALFIDALGKTSFIDKSPHVKASFIFGDMKFVLGDHMEVAIWWGGNGTFDKGGCKFGEEHFSGTEE